MGGWETGHSCNEVVRGSMGDWGVSGKLSNGANSLSHRKGRQALEVIPMLWKQALGCCHWMHLRARQPEHTHACPDCQTTQGHVSPAEIVSPSLSFFFFLNGKQQFPSSLGIADDHMLIN